MKNPKNRQIIRKKASKIDFKLIILMPRLRLNKTPPKSLFKSSQIRLLLKEHKIRKIHSKILTSELKKIHGNLRQSCKRQHRQARLLKLKKIKNLHQTIGRTVLTKINPMKIRQHKLFNSLACRRTALNSCYSPKAPCESATAKEVNAASSTVYVSGLLSNAIPRFACALIAKMMTESPP